MRNSLWMLGHRTCSKGGHSNLETGCQSHSLCTLYKVFPPTVFHTAPLGHVHLKKGSCIHTFLLYLYQTETNKIHKSVSEQVKMANKTCPRCNHVPLFQLHNVPVCSIYMSTSSYLNHVANPVHQLNLKQWLLQESPRFHPHHQHLHLVSQTQLLLFPDKHL